MERLGHAALVAGACAAVAERTQPLPHLGSVVEASSAAARWPFQFRHTTLRLRPRSRAVGSRGGGPRVAKLIADADGGRTPALRVHEAVVDRRVH
jgi:hypothetical protein